MSLVISLKRSDPTRNNEVLKYHCSNIALNEQTWKTPIFGREIGNIQYKAIHIHAYIHVRNVWRQDMKAFTDITSFYCF
jgi:hypothetical protein